MTLKVIAWPAFSNKEFNPYNWLLYKNLLEKDVSIDEFSILNILRNKYDIWHIHWPDKILNNSQNLKVAKIKSLVLFTLMKISKMKGTRIVWTTHNLKTHEGLHESFEDEFWKKYYKLVDGTINMTGIGYRAMVKRFGEDNYKKNTIIPHGHYCDIYPNEITQNEARTKLNIPLNAKVIAFVGLIREYKNVTNLVKVFKGILDKDVYLIVAGNPINQSLNDEIQNSARNNNNIQLHLKFIPNEDIQVFLNAANLVVLPYKDILNSGSSLLSLSFKKPILVPKIGALGELQKEVGPEWVYTYEGMLDEKIILKTLNAIFTSRQPLNLDPFGWENISTKTLEFYKSLS